jgi:Fe-S-cluster containining protein
MECKRCGVCCEKGGPVLHHEDRVFLHKNIVSVAHLTVIRQGELAYNPFKEKVEPAPVEMIKLAGLASSWECPFHQKDGVLSACAIHADRPCECRLLKCWDTSAIEDLVFKDCLTRFDLLGAENPLLPEIRAHEECCAYRELWSLVDELGPNVTSAQIKAIQVFLAQDMHIRKGLIAQYGLTLSQELFYLGQPMFQVVDDSALSISFTHDTLQVRSIG